MSGAGIVAFEDPALGSACDELEALGPDFAERLLLYLQKVQSKMIDYRTLKPFATIKASRCSWREWTMIWPCFPSKRMHSTI